MKHHEFTRMADSDAGRKGNRYMNLDLHLTTACNMKCSFCGAWEYGRKQAYISETDAENALEAGRKCGYRITTLTGGEPSIHPSYCSILKTAYEKGYWTVVTTNGLYLTDKMIETYRKCRTLVRVSLHTLERRKHERMTETDSLQQIIENVKRLEEAGIRTGIGCTVTDENMEEIWNLAALAWDSGAEFIRYTPVVGIRGAANQQIGYDFFSRLLREIWLMTLTNSGLLESKKKEMSFLQGIMEFMLTRKCAGGSGQHIIYDCHGTVVPCSFIPEQMGLCCGRDGQAENPGAKNDTVMEIEDRIKVVREKMNGFLDEKKAERLEGRCHTCYYRKSCLGGCMTMKIPAGLEMTDEQPVCLMNLIKAIGEEFTESEKEIVYSCWCSSFLRKSGTRDKDRICIRRLPIWELDFRRGIGRHDKRWTYR